MLKKILATLIILILIFLGGVYFYIQSFGPTYEGEIKLEGLDQEVHIYFDEFGIPHIYGQTEEDVYFALGYAHAQERAFQMDLMRRAAQGRLSEIMGSVTLDTDRFFRTVGLHHAAKEAAKEYFSSQNKPFQKTAMAYINGVNAYINNGNSSIEHALLQVPLEPFTIEDAYSIGGLMAIGFAEAFKTEPVVEHIRATVGPSYLTDLAMDYPEGDTKIMTTPTDTTNISSDMAAHLEVIHDALNAIPVPLWAGSNGWVIAPSKTKSGKVILANDTHMGYGQPSVWYEAHLEAPGFSLYGRHAAGVPFALIGHNRTAAWGLTMFENDDVDFYRERSNPANPKQYWAKDHWEEFSTRKETILVKDSASVEMTIRSTQHGPIVSDLSTYNLYHEGQEPIALWWAFLEFKTQSIETFYEMARAKDINDARAAAKKLDVPGLNVMFGDADGNIAWWASAKLFRRPDHVQSKMILNGADGTDEHLGYLGFEYNPKSENPASGYVYSANNQPDSMNGLLVPGYYVSEHRAKEIAAWLEKEDSWDTEKVMEMNFNTTSSVASSIAHQLADLLSQNAYKDNIHQQAITHLKSWDGSHDLEDIAPSIYYKLEYFTLKLGMEDELGEKMFNPFLTTHLLKRSWATFSQNDTSIWWDNIQTENVVEKRSEIISQAFDLALNDLQEHFGNMSDWRWEKVHTLKHNHAFSSQAMLDPYFSVGTFGVVGGNETINNSLARLYPNKQHGFSAVVGPAMRTIIDFSDIENSVSVIPTGQSGFPFSPHYDDQVTLYNTGKNRKQMMNKEEILQKHKSKLLLFP